jgi:hypothetical protein
MNNFIAIDIDYLWANKTIETVLVTNGSSREVYYVYNHEGISFSVFRYISDINKYFKGSKEPDFHFDTDYMLDKFFETASLDKNIIKS